ncbi:MAG: rhomboid family intramembrane serine protease [Verrucomicrobiia bacterium]
MPAARKNRSLKDAVQISFWLVGLLFAVEAVEVLTRVNFERFGIIPRHPYGLVGVFVSPLLHGSAAHLAANAVPLFVLLTIVLWDKQYRAGQSLPLIWLLSGLGTWLIGRAYNDGVPTVHLGASSIVYGLVAYIITAGFLMDSWRAIGVAVVVGIFYGGIFYGVLPQDSHISWEAHLCGALAGVWVARQNHLRRRR